MDLLNKGCFELCIIFLGRQAGQTMLFDEWKQESVHNRGWSGGDELRRLPIASRKPYANVALLRGLTRGNRGCGLYKHALGVQVADEAGGSRLKRSILRLALKIAIHAMDRREVRLFLLLAARDAIQRWWQ